MNKVGIGCDNYKIEKFKEELTEAGLTNFEVKPFTQFTSIITVTVQENRFNEVHEICKKVQAHFKNEKP